MRGFLGGTNLSDWLLAWALDGPFPCHKTTPVNEAGNVDVERLDEARYCAGSLIVRVNSSSLPRTPGQERAWALVEPDTELVFANIAEFYTHHARKNT